MTYEELEPLVIEWAKARKIVYHSTPMAQAIKTAEEVVELLKALSRNDDYETKDAYGDILVTLIVGSAMADIDLMEALESAYNTIKDRKGYLSADGIFIKEE